MAHGNNRKNRVSAGVWAGALVTSLAALIIGCGGGGGDTSITGTTAVSGFTATASTSTASTSTASTSTASTSTASTSTASTSTASTSTASTSTATSSTGSGVLPQNVIFFTDSPSQTSTVLNYNYVTPTGGTGTLLASLSANFGGIALNSVNQKKYFSYCADPTNPSFGIYTNSTYSITGATTIVAPSTTNPVSFAGELQLSPDGTTLYYLAGIGSNEPIIYSVPTGGGVAPTALDSAADTFNLNLAGTQLVYGKVISNNLQIFTRAVAPTSTPVQITNNGNFSSDEPQWNKAGTQIAFTADVNQPNNVYQNYVFTMNPDGTNVKQVTNTANQDDHTPSYNTAGSSLSFVSFSGGSVSTQGLYTVSLGGAVDLNRTEIYPDASILTGTYWTTTGGRSNSLGWSFINNWKRKHGTLFSPSIQAKPKPAVTKPASRPGTP